MGVSLVKFLSKIERKKNLYVQTPKKKTKNKKQNKTKTKYLKNKKEEKITLAVHAGSYD